MPSTSLSNLRSSTFNVFVLKYCITHSNTPSAVSLYLTNACRPAMSLEASSPAINVTKSPGLIRPPFLAVNPALSIFAFVNSEVTSSNPATLGESAVSTSLPIMSSAFTPETNLNFGLTLSSNSYAFFKTSCDNKAVISLVVNPFNELGETILEYTLLKSPKAS